MGRRGWGEELLLTFLRFGGGYLHFALGEFILADLAESIGGIVLFCERLRGNEFCGHDVRRWSTRSGNEIWVFISLPPLGLAFHAASFVSSSIISLVVPSPQMESSSALVFGVALPVSQSSSCRRLASRVT